MSQNITPRARRGTAGKNSSPSSLLSRAVKAGAGKTLAVSALLSLALTAAAYWYLLLPMDSAAADKRQQLAQLRKQNAIARTVQETRPAFFEEYAHAKEVYELARNQLPESTELSRVMAVFQKIASQTNVRIIDFNATTLGVKSSLDSQAGGQPQQKGKAAPPAPEAQPGQPQPAEPANVLKERVIPAQVVGRHAAVLSFFREIGRHDLIVHAREPKIDVLNNQQNVNIKLVAFEAPPTKALPADPPGLKQASDRSANGVSRIRAKGVVRQ